MTDVEAAELKRLREERDHLQTLRLRAEAERDQAVEDRRRLDEQLENARDRIDAMISIAVFWREHVEAARAELAEERKERDALVKLEVEQLTGRKPKRRGRPPSTWSPESEADVERMYRDGASTRQIAADLGMSKSEVHRRITRVRQCQAAAAELARLAAIAAGRSPTQLAARGAKRAAERHPIEDYDPVRAERGAEYLRSRRAEAETNE